MPTKITYLRRTENDACQYDEANQIVERIRPHRRA